jgi:D-glycero-beta-D-manno-heptose-7-phosphate kinase
MKTLEQVFRKFNDLKILVIGDVMVDSYVWGKVTRISPEAPIPVVGANAREERLGGAANVALNLKELGVSPILCSVIGNDLESNIFLKLLDKAGISSKGILKSEERITTIKHRIIAENQHLLRVDSETEKDLSDDESVKFWSLVQKIGSETDAIIFEDYDKGVLTSRIISQVVGWAKEQGIPTAVDPKKKNFFEYEKVDLFKPNLKELEDSLGVAISGSSMKQIQEAIEKLRLKMNYGSTLLTLSENGVFIDVEGKSKKLKAHKREISDVSGAGDSVIGIATAALALGLPMEFCADLANLGGGLVCEHPGVVPINKIHLFEEALKSMPLDSYGLEG